MLEISRIKENAYRSHLSQVSRSGRGGGRGGEACGSIILPSHLFNHSWLRFTWTNLLLILSSEASEEVSKIALCPNGFRAEGVDYERVNHGFSGRAAHWNHLESSYNDLSEPELQISDGKGR